LQEIARRLFYLTRLIRCYRLIGASCSDTNDRALCIRHDTATARKAQVEEQEEDGDAGRESGGDYFGSFVSE
jgi:hypothetical protein